ncbi:MAG: V-type ATP synthase subunit F [Firmicutes bacterium]|jgi:V/A-type H+-transporting ATPase subunit F|nr:V-type ATP synthase subunit F [Bacillota bacterium]
MHRIGVIGDEDSILGFRALGVSVFPVSDERAAEERLHALAREDYAAIFITEGFAKGIIDAITEYSKRPLPVVLTIPDNRGNTGAALEKIRRTVERALGADILFGKEGNAS